MAVLARVRTSCQYLSHKPVREVHMTDIDSILIASRTHRKAVEAFLGFACLYPCHEDVQPLLDVLADDIRVSFDNLNACIQCLASSQLPESD